MVGFYFLRWTQTRSGLRSCTVGLFWSQCGLVMKCNKVITRTAPTTAHIVHWFGALGISSHAANVFSYVLSWHFRWSVWQQFDRRTFWPLVWGLGALWRPGGIDKFGKPPMGSYYLHIDTYGLLSLTDLNYFAGLKSVSVCPPACPTRMWWQSLL